LDNPEKENQTLWHTHKEGGGTIDGEKKGVGQPQKGLLPRGGKGKRSTKMGRRKGPKGGAGNSTSVTKFLAERRKKRKPRKNQRMGWERAGARGLRIQ